MGSDARPGQGVAAKAIAKLKALRGLPPVSAHPKDVGVMSRRSRDNEHRRMYDFKGVDWNMKTRNGKVDPGFVKEFLEGIMASDWFACEIRNESGRIVAGFDGERPWTEQQTREEAA
jgi:hypothetical protein